MSPTALTQTRRLGELHHAIEAGLDRADADLSGARAGDRRPAPGPLKAGRHHPLRPHRHGRAGYRHRHPRPPPRPWKQALDGPSIRKNATGGRRERSPISTSAERNMPSASPRRAKRWRAPGIDLLIVTDPSNMHWLTGYDGWSFYVHQCVLVPPDGEPIWYGRGQDANGAKRTAYLAPRQHHRLSGPLRSVDRTPSDGLPVRDHRRARLGQGHHRRRDGQLLFLRRRLSHRSSSICRMRDSRMPCRW